MVPKASGGAHEKEKTIHLGNRVLVSTHEHLSNLIKIRTPCKLRINTKAFLPIVRGLQTRQRPDCCEDVQTRVCAKPYTAGCVSWRRRWHG
jgi:hypothetical protein